MTKYSNILKDLSCQPKKWLITGVAGFIGSNLLEVLLRANQYVIGLDNFSFGNSFNLEQVKNSLSKEQWSKFIFYETDICNYDECLKCSMGVDYVLHHAAIGSVEASLLDPAESHRTNVDGFLNMLLAARESDVKTFLYASSSAVYGDNLDAFKVEERTGKLLSPYAGTKQINEVYASIFSRCYGLNTVGLRYFNIFGKRQDPNGAYAAVIPAWIKA